MKAKLIITGLLVIGVVTVPSAHASGELADDDPCNTTDWTDDVSEGGQNVTNGAIDRDVNRIVSGYGQIMTSTGDYIACYLTA